MATSKQKKAQVVAPYGAMPPKRARPAKYGTFASLVGQIEPHIYLMARLRPEGEGVRSFTLGTAYLAGKNRIVSAAHCFDDPNQPNAPGAHHQEGDSYIFIQIPSRGGGHYAVVETPVLDSELYLYPDIDFAVMYLPDSFYAIDGKWHKNPDDHLSFSNELRPLGTDVGVLGYPMQELRFTSAGSPDTDGVMLRVDKGVVNASMSFTENGNTVYEFTMSFNPGNSGGPIVEIASGRVIATVMGYRATPINLLTEKWPGQDPDAKTFDSLIHANYSQGFTSVNYLTLAARHGLSTF